MPNSAELPDTPGEWWFTGEVIIPHSTTPGNNVTLHVAARRILMVQSPHFGLLPCDPQTLDCYGMYTFIGVWEGKRRSIATSIPHELTDWLD